MKVKRIRKSVSMLCVAALLVASSNFVFVSKAASCKSNSSQANKNYYMRPLKSDSSNTLSKKFNFKVSNNIKPSVKTNSKLSSGIEPSGAGKIKLKNFTKKSIGSVKKHAENYSKANSTGIWRIEQNVFNDDGQLTTNEYQDLYVVQTTSDTAPTLKISSTNSNIIAELFIYDTSKGTITPTSFIDSAGDDNYQIAGKMAAGTYIIAVGSSDNTAQGKYTLMWNCSNPSGASRILYVSSNLDLVTLGYQYQDIKSNGNELIDRSALKWDEEWTLTFSTGYYGRNQSVSAVDTSDMKSDIKLDYGTYSTNKYSTNHALLVELGKGTSWCFMRSYYNNVNGQVEHTMDWTDVTGQETPRNFTDADVALGPHYLVIDLEKNLIVDFASPYNYLWYTGEITGKATITASDI